MTDLLELAAELVAIPSVSHEEDSIATSIEQSLSSCDHLRVRRIGDSVIAGTDLGRKFRVLLAGHVDTVPPFAGFEPHTDGETLRGLGAVDMKGGLAVLLDLARTVTRPECDVTFLFYACEEVEHRHNQLVHIARDHRDLLRADAAILGEPTGGIVEAGCQGTMRVSVAMAGKRAHTARPWQGTNAIHRLGPVIERIRAYEPRSVQIDGCEYREQMQAVSVAGGIAGNVVPDSARLVVNFRFAPDRDVDAAQLHLRGFLADVIDEHAGDSVELIDVSPAAPPSLTHPLLEKLLEHSARPPRAKLGWTDVATLWSVGVPAANFGPGDPALAHTPDEVISRAELDSAREALGRLLSDPC